LFKKNKFQKKDVCFELTLKIRIAERKTHNEDQRKKKKEKK